MSTASRVVPAGSAARRASRPRGHQDLLLKSRRGLEQAHLCLGVRSYPLAHPDRYALQVLSTVLGGGMSSRLFTEVRERRGLAYYVYGLNHSYTDAGSLYAQAGVDINRIDDAVSTVAGELQKIATEPVPSDELEKAKSFAKGRFVLQLETSQGLIMFGLRREVLESRTPDPEEILEAMRQVGKVAVARIVLSGRERLVTIQPIEDGFRMTTLRAARSGLAEAPPPLAVAKLLREEDQKKDAEAESDLELAVGPLGGTVRVGLGVAGGDLLGDLGGLTHLGLDEDVGVDHVHLLGGMWRLS